MNVARTSAMAGVAAVALFAAGSLTELDAPAVDADWLLVALAAGAAVGVGVGSRALTPNARRRLPHAADDAEFIDTAGHA